MGISFLPRFTVEKDLLKGSLMELDTDLPQVTMYHQIFCHQGKWMTPQLKRFLELAKRRLEEM